jgi:hypothetical protein
MTSKPRETGGRRQGTGDRKQRTEARMLVGRDLLARRQKTEDRGKSANISVIPEKAGI